MEDKKDLTKHLIAESVKELVRTIPFEKMTIKKITDKAGLIRPAFYRYFLDKYDVVDWIFRNEVLEETFQEAEKGNRKQALIVLFSKMREEREFYQHIFQITGQNSLEESMERELRTWYLGVLRKDPQIIEIRSNPVLTPEHVAEFKSGELTHFIKVWILDTKEDPSPEQLAEAFCYLSSYSIIGKSTVFRKEEVLKNPEREPGEGDPPGEQNQKK